MEEIYVKRDIQISTVSIDDYVDANMFILWENSIYKWLYSSLWFHNLRTNEKKFCEQGADLLQDLMQIKGEELVYKLSIIRLKLRSFFTKENLETNFFLTFRNYSSDVSHSHYNNRHVNR